MAWDHPVWQAAPQTLDSRTRAGDARQVFSLERAFASVAQDDPRPLLVLRDCFTCSGTDDALMTRAADNEKTMLMARWFHCVRLPPDVLEDDHPFRVLFPGEKPPHLFVALPDGSGRVDLMGDQSRTELWGAMEGVLSKGYLEKPDKALRQLFRLLDRLDEVDVDVAELQKQLDDVVEKDGPGSRKFKKLRAELDELRAERNELRDEAIAASDLKLREREEAAASEPVGEGAAKQG